MDYQTRFMVYKHTQQFANIYYRNIATTVKYTENDFNIVPKQGQNPIVDSLDSYVVLLKEGFNPVLLNMASDTTPGGCSRRKYI